MASVTC
jgi:hypothetical protein